MTRDDYIAWAEEYRQEADVLSEKIREKEERLKSRFSTPMKRAAEEEAIRIMYDMRSDCLYAMKILLARAGNMKE